MTNPRVPAGLAAMLVLSLACRSDAQLSGFYTIDASQPTGGTNYASFVAAAADLAALGVSGPVSFAVVASATPYAGFAIVAPINGAGATQTITFTGIGDVVLSGPASGFTQVVRLGTTSVSTGTGPSYLVFENLTLTGAPSGAGLIATRCSNIIVRNCKVIDCGSGIYFGATTSSVVEDCDISGVGNTCGTPGSSTYSGGIAAYSNASDNVFQRNRVHDGTGNGIFVGASSSATASLNVVVVNNFVWNMPGLGTYPGGIALRRAGNAIVANNSIGMPGGTANAGIHHMAGSSDPTPAEISNNIVRHDGTGACIKIESTTSSVPAILDHNLYDAGGLGSVGAVGTTLYPTLAAWQGVSSPNLSGLELGSLAAPAGFISATNLHILPGSAGYDSGSAVPAVSVDVDLQARPIGALPDRGADETPALVLFAEFSGNPPSGAAPLLVTFQDQSFSSAPAGIQTWAWDFDGDGVVDSTAPSPSFTYTCPGRYAVSLTVTDGVNPAATLSRTDYIDVGEFVFDIATSGSGIGDLTVTPVPTTCGLAAGAVSGWSLVSFATALPPGSGPVFGIVPDASTFAFLFHPAAPGDIVHFFAAPGLYPDAGPVHFPAGTLPNLAGMSMDALMVFLDASGNLLLATNVDRVTF